MNQALERFEAEVAEIEAHYNRLAEQELRRRDEALLLADEVRHEIASDLEPMWMEPYTGPF